jgi:hypothetical protein
MDEESPIRKFHELAVVSGLPVITLGIRMTFGGQIVKSNSFHWKAPMNFTSPSAALDKTNCATEFYGISLEM